MSEFGREELEAWLEGKPREVCVAIAHRAALRAVPFYARYINNWIEGRNLDNDMTVWFWCSLTSGVAGTWPTPEVKAAADAAAYAADSAAADAAAYAADSAAADAAFWKALERDTILFEDGTVTDVAGLLGHPIWPHGLPEEIKPFAEQLHQHLENETELSFWSRWYLSAERGAPMDWEMQKEIALIPDADWEKGAAHVAGVIAEIEGRYAPRLDQEKIAQTVERLLAFPEMSKAAALKAADDVEGLCTEFLRKAELNDLPQELRAFGSLKTILRRIAQVIGDSSSNDHKIAILEAQIADLHQTVALLNEELEAASKGVVSEEFKKAVGKSAANPLWWSGWAGVIGYSYYFFTDPAGASAMIENLVSAGKEAVAGAPDAEARKLPQIE